MTGPSRVQESSDATDLFIGEISPPMLSETLDQGKTNNDAVGYSNMVPGYALNAHSLAGSAALPQLPPPHRPATQSTHTHSCHSYSSSTSMWYSSPDCAPATILGHFTATLEMGDGALKAPPPSLRRRVDPSLSATLPDVSKEAPSPLLSSRRLRVSDQHNEE